MVVAVQKKKIVKRPALRKRTLIDRTATYQAEVEVKVEVKSHSCNLSLGLNLNLSKLPELLPHDHRP